MYHLTHTVHTRAAARIFVTTLIATLVLFCAWSAHGQDFGTTTGLLQAERIARVTTVYDDTLRAASDTTAWVAFGTHNADLASERTFAPTRFTLFVKLDTAGIAHADAPSLTLTAQVALNDTLTAYEQFDSSLDLIASTAPLTETEPGQSIIVPVYGGGWLRFILSNADSARVQLNLWRVR